MEKKSKSQEILELYNQTQKLYYETKARQVLEELEQKGIQTDEDIHQYISSLELLDFKEIEDQLSQ